jgi:hypothetical protein
MLILCERNGKLALLFDSILQVSPIILKYFSLNIIKNFYIFLNKKRVKDAETKTD